MIYWFIGVPGTGKTYVARLFATLTGFPQFEGDDFQTEDDRKVIAAGAFTLEHRYAQLSRISTALKDAGVTNGVVTHPLPDTESRRLVRESGNAQLVYVRAPLAVIRGRLKARKDHHFGSELLTPWLKQHWAEPTQEEGCLVIDNFGSGETLEAQLRRLASTP